MVENQYSTELILNIPLRDAKKASKARRADVAIEVVKDFVSRFTKSERENIWIDNKVNEALWKRGKFKIPSHITVKIIKLQEGTTEVILP
ncbi:MAG: 50S ribosomal protein L31e [Thermoplasmataceae archaeon]|uniref:50S ribosomal protein L31e n=1 Tax=mine drainage metagenome TaxID=410659 RepID=T0YHR3_9ZZZZ